MKQEKLTNKELDEYQCYIIGAAMPVKEQAGFAGVFGRTKVTDGDNSDGRLVLLDEFESVDIIVLVEVLAWWTTKFSFRGSDEYPYSDFIFCDGKDMVMDDQFCRRGVKMLTH